MKIKNSSHGKRAHPVVVINETADGSFSLASSPCAQTLEPGQQCTVSLTFTPARMGKQSGAMTIDDNDRTKVRRRCSCWVRENKRQESRSRRTAIIS